MSCFCQLVCPLEQWGAAIGVRGDRLHYAGGRQRRDPIVHGAGTGDRAGGRTDRHQSHSSECHRQGWHLSKQSGENTTTRPTTHNGCVCGAVSTDLKISTRTL